MKVPHKLRLYSSTSYESPAPDGYPSSCPTLDISATLNSSCQNVIVFRPNGEQVGRIQQSARSSSVVTATRWKPNGQFIAVAWKDGFVRLMAVETSKSAHNIRVVPPDCAAEIQFLAWTTTQISVEGGIIRPSSKISPKKNMEGNLPREITFLETDVSLPKLSPLPLASAGSGEDSLVFTQRSGMDFMFQPFKPSDAEAISVMLSGLSNGQVHISIHDSLSIGSLAYPSTESSIKKRLVHHSAHSSLSTHMLYFKDGTGDNTAVEMVPLDLQFIVSSPVNLSLMASKLTTLHKLLRYVRQAILHIQVEFKNSREIQARFLKSAIATFKEDDGMQQDITTALYHSMTTGNVYPKLKEWLTETLGERGLKRWIKAATGGLDGIRNLTQIYLIPALERIVIILSRLKGLALFHHGRHDIGLNPLEIQRLVDTVGCLMLVANRILMFSMEEAACFAQFMSWLHITLEHLNNQSLADEISEKQVHLDYSKVLLYIVEYLHESSNRHYIHSDTGDGSLDELLQKRAGKDGSMMDALTDIIEKVHDDNEQVSAEEAKLVQLGHLVGLLARSMNTVLDSVAVAQRRGIRFGEPVLMDVEEEIFRLDSRIVPGEKDSSDRIVFYRTLFTVANGISGTPHTQCSFLSLGPGRVLDISFFDDDTLFALVDPQNNAPHAIYAIPLKSLHWDLHGSTNSNFKTFPPMPLSADFHAVAMEVHEQSEVRDQLPARVCLLSKDRMCWRTYALEKDTQPGEDDGKS
ncbi:hypothetical protein TD95_004569 [Thielaviopsis punctulata]|uniref:Anaphase-promoting complex subunit 4 n=1 Tax=Thielaviopsis punctulata TaxID=72032 RepID=A0A0F4ZJN1_9PEZI|nr:hypothetical protein TD95_004569 [Thielaviopsis punctulata]